MAKIIDQERQETVEETTQEPVQEELTLDQAVVSEEPQQPQPAKPLTTIAINGKHKCQK